MEFKDYYAVLGVEPEASVQSIRQAYHKLARRYHPDMNPGDSSAEERFKEISEAYQILSHNEHRQKYDSLHQQYRRGLTKSGNFSWTDWLLASDYVGYNFFFNMLDAFLDIDEKPEHWNSTTRGEDLEITVQITLEEAFHGTYRHVRIGQRRVEIYIPPGIQSGTELIVEKHGKPGSFGIKPGDLYVIVLVQPHAVFKRNGNDLTTEVPVDIYTALLGGEVPVPTLDEKEVMLTIPPRTQADSVFCLHCEGMPLFGLNWQRGDLYVRVKLVFPDLLTETEFDILCKLAQQRKKNGI